MAIAQKAKAQLKRRKLVRNLIKAFPTAVFCTTLYEHVVILAVAMRLRNLCSFRGILKTIIVESSQPLTLVLGMLLTRMHWINLNYTSNFALGLYEHNPKKLSRPKLSLMLMVRTKAIHSLWTVFLSFSQLNICDIDASKFLKHPSYLKPKLQEHPSS